MPGVTKGKLLLRHRLTSQVFLVHFTSSRTWCLQVAKLTQRYRHILLITLPRFSLTTALKGLSAEVSMCFYLLCGPPMNVAQLYKDIKNVFLPSSQKSASNNCPWTFFSWCLSAFCTYKSP